MQRLIEDGAQSLKHISSPKNIHFSVYCGSPGNPQRGWKSGTVYRVGSTVYFHCYYSGEILSGTSSTTCQSNGKWSNPTPPRCKYR